MTDTENTGVRDEEVAQLYSAMGGPRNPDLLGRQLESSFTMAGRRRITLAVLAVMAASGLLAVAIWAVLNDTGLDFGDDSALFSSTEASEGFTTEEVAGASASPDLADAPSAPLTQTVAVVAGQGPAASRIVEQPDPAVFPIAPGTVTASLVTFRSVPAVAILGPADWYAGTCIQITSIDPSGEPSAPIWVAARLGSCGGDATGTGVVPVCTGPRGMIVRLAANPATDTDTDTDTAGSVSVDVFAVNPDFETLLVTGTVPVAGGLTDWPAALADDGATITMTGIPDAAGGGRAECVVG